MRNGNINSTLGGIRNDIIDSDGNDLACKLNKRGIPNSITKEICLSKMEYKDRRYAYWTCFKFIIDEANRKKEYDNQLLERINYLQNGLSTKENILYGLGAATLLSVIIGVFTKPTGILATMSIIVLIVILISPRLERDMLKHSANFDCFYTNESEIEYLKKAIGITDVY